MQYLDFLCLILRSKSHIINNIKICNRSVVHYFSITALAFDNRTRFVF